ncbi:hypothetical protein ABB30_03160 [Stenotrophomonas ginsengisoli]|uniref:Uncharacterized protein n=1 Tax=Stenotrophomonas ginsengisoli TaxID=336566 RepID=A0A0R0DAK6_9GAMM|nr:hypothetical protein ABB30_03160 [Stenotrophomonas ginsengisoli]
MPPLQPFLQRRLVLLLPVLAGALLLLGVAVGQRLPQAGLEAPAPLPVSSLLPATTRVLGLSRQRDDQPAGNAIPALPLDMAAGLEGRGNLYDYARQLQYAVAAGDAQAGWTLSRIHDYCGQYLQDPQGYALDDRLLATAGGGPLQALVAARSRLGQRCHGFAPADQPGHAGIVLQRRRAAQAGHLAAEAALLAMGQPLSDDDDYRRQLVERVIQSQDPEAFLALSPAMGAVAAGDAALHDAVAGTQFTQLAWQVAACRLGMACGPDSVLMSSYCANAGICSRKPDQDFESFVFDAAVPPQGVEKMNQLINQLRRPRGVRS